MTGTVYAQTGSIDLSIKVETGGAVLSKVTEVTCQNGFKSQSLNNIPLNQNCTLAINTKRSGQEGRGPFYMINPGAVVASIIETYNADGELIDSKAYDRNFSDEKRAELIQQAPYLNSKPSDMYYVDTIIKNPNAYKGSVFDKLRRGEEVYYKSVRKASSGRVLTDLYSVNLILMNPSSSSTSFRLSIDNPKLFCQAKLWDNAYRAIQKEKVDITPKNSEHSFVIDYYSPKISCTSSKVIESRPDNDCYHCNQGSVNTGPNGISVFFKALITPIFLFSNNLR